MNKNLDNIIRESIREMISEMDVVPTDANGGSNLIRRRQTNAWRAIYNLMDNVKSSMNYTYKDKQGRVTNKDIDGIIDYIYNSLQNITKNI